MQQNENYNYLYMLSNKLLINNVKLETTIITKQNEIRININVNMHYEELCKIKDISLHTTVHMKLNLIFKMLVFCQSQALT